MTVQPDKPRGTKRDRRLDTKEEPAVRHEERSVGQVTGPEMLYSFIFTKIYGAAHRAAP